MAEAENCRGECGGGLLVDITGCRKTKTERCDKSRHRWLTEFTNADSPLCPTPVRPG